VCGVVFHRNDTRRRVRDASCEDNRVYLQFLLRRVECLRCSGVKNDQLNWLANNPLNTLRFTFYVGRRRCRISAMPLDLARREFGFTTRHDTFRDTKPLDI
jgi:hypothetical protein